MGFSDYLRKIFSSDEEAAEAELRAARARHGITVDERKEEEEDKEPFDPWEEVKNARMNFLMGSWASRKFHIIGEEKVKQQLEELEKKRMEKEKEERSRGEGGE